MISSSARVRSAALAVLLLATGGATAADRAAVQATREIEGCRSTENGTVVEVLTNGTCNAYIGMTFKIDVDVSVDARQLAGSGAGSYGVMFGRKEIGDKGDASFYQFAVSSNGQHRLRFFDGTRDSIIVDWTRHPAIKTGLDTVNSLRVVTQNDIIRCFVNGVYVGGARVGSGLIGGVGYIVEEHGTRAKFEGLTGRSLGTSVETMPLPGRTLFIDDLRTRQTFQVGGGLPCRASYDAEGYVVENLAMSPNGLCDLPLVAAGSFGSNVLIEISAKLRRGPMNRSFGPLFGRAGALTRPMYIGVIDGQGTFQITQRTNAWQRLTHLYVHNEVIKGLEVWNRIGIEIRGQTIRGYVNGQLVETATASSLVEGLIGLYLDAPGMIGVFRDLKVTQN